MRAWTLRLIATFLCALGTAAGAEPLGVGDRIEPLTLEDQHGEEHRIDTDVHVVLLSRDMDGGDVLKEALADATAQTLENQGAVYVADISGMPGLVARLFAIPSMRRRPYPMLLDRDGSKVADFPSAEGRATLVRLNDLKIASVEHFAGAEGIRRALGIETP